MSEPEETPVTTEEKEEEPAPLIEEAKLDEIITPETEEIDPDAEVSVHATMEKAIENYRKIKEGKKELTDKELEDLEKECEAIRQREVNGLIPEHGEGLDLNEYETKLFEWSYPELVEKYYKSGKPYPKLTETGDINLEFLN